MGIPSNKFLFFTSLLVVVEVKLAGLGLGLGLGVGLGLGGGLGLGLGLSKLPWSTTKNFKDSTSHLVIHARVLLNTQSDNFVLLPQHAFLCDIMRLILQAKHKTKSCD